MAVLAKAIACVLLAVATAASVHAEEMPPPRAIVEAAVAAHGGENWLEPGTLALSGHAVFFAPDGATSGSKADDYRMWRVMDPNRTMAHGANGKVRIIARSGERTLFEVGFDGETTWNQDGIVPKAEADKFWASSFGFGIVRSALDEGFSLEAAPSREIGGRAIDLVRIIDPQGQPTLFGFDRESRFIRYMGFRTPRGWHERIYDDFVRLPDTGWVQAREVTLFYDGVKSNTVYWREIAVGQPIAAETFIVPRQ